MFRRRRRPAATVDPAEQAREIAGLTGLPIERVAVVLEVEFEHLVASGIADDPDHPFRVYDATERARLAKSKAIDIDEVARDAERLAGVPVDVARSVLEAETGCLARRGLLGR